MMTKMEIILTSNQHVFTTQDLALFWNLGDKKTLWNNIRYYLRTGKLIRLHKGVYATGEYSSYELCQKLITPSYISFYTALSSHGVISQYYDTIHAMALVSKQITTKKQKFQYHKLKEIVFYNPLGITNNTTFRIASPERAVCDSLYLIPSLGFDKLGFIDPIKLKKISQIYQNKKLEERVAKLISYA